MPITPQPTLAPIPDPGAYLQLRRLVAGLALDQVADRLAALPWAIAPASPAQRDALRRRLETAELDGQHFTAPQAALLAQIYPFDVNVYCALVDLDAAGPGFGLPIPQVCRHCGCSFHDACTHLNKPCAWSDDDPQRCTACPPIRATTPTRQAETVS